MRFLYGSVILAAAALGLLAGSPASAQKVQSPQVQFVPTKQAPQAPQGLQLACIKNAGNGAPTSDTCPVVKYQGVTTWAYSYADNRTSFALVSYDESGKLLRNVEKQGARYIFDATSSEANKTVMFVGQAQGRVTVPWSELGSATK